jgi:hypothetical protein
MTSADPPPRQLISDAGGMPIDDRRRLVLLDALERLGHQDQGPDDLEARAVALAMLAQHDPNLLPAAEEALGKAEEAHVPLNWILMHLAEALLLAGSLEDLLSIASRIELDYFDAEDLHWRAVRLAEMCAVALLGLGRLKEGIQSAKGVSAELALRGDSDDLAPPGLLVEGALGLVAAAASTEAVRAGCEVLHEISSSIELNAWFPEDTIKRIQEALAGCQ